MDAGRTEPTYTPAEVALREAKLAAAEAYFQKYAVPPLTEEAIGRIEAEWQLVCQHTEEA